MSWLAGLAVVGVIQISSAPTCRAPELERERRDVVTIQRLEAAWSAAFLQGDTTFERCLLAPQFTQILRTGNLAGLASELALAAKNTAHPQPVPILPTPTVLLFGDGAVAYGAVKRKTMTTRYADFYVWIGSRWQVVFAQQTVVQGS